MPQEASKLSNPDAAADAAPEATAESSKQNAAAESADESDEETATVEGGEGAEKKKSRKRKIKDALTGKGKAPEITSTESPAGGHLSKDQMTQLLESNPALKQELMAKSKNPKDLEQMIRKLNINEMLTGLAPEGKNTKDMASHAFWKTQPVPSFDEMAAKEKIEDGPIKHIEIDKVDKNPSPMYPGFEWVTMDLEDEKQLDEVYDLLTNHYVEDKDATFRFKYSPSFLNWYVYHIIPSARLTITGPSKHPAGKKNGMSACAQPAPASSSPSSPGFPSPCASEKRHSTAPKSTSSVYTRSCAPNASRPSSSRKSPAAATSKAPSRPSTPSDPCSPPPCLHAATFTALSTGRSCTTLASPRSRTTAPSSAKSSAINYRM
jgi:hypothetical protein